MVSIRHPRTPVVSHTLISSYNIWLLLSAKSSAGKGIGNFRPKDNHMPQIGSIWDQTEPRSRIPPIREPAGSAGKKHDFKSTWYVTLGFHKQPLCSSDTHYHTGANRTIHCKLHLHLKRIFKHALSEPFKWQKNRKKKWESDQGTSRLS